MYYKIANSKQRKTLEQIFTTPVPSNIEWKYVESLLKAQGAEITQGSGSRIRIKLNNVRAVFHRPHPKKKKQIKGVLFL
mgnify:CR=1 FL=1